MHRAVLDAVIDRAPERAETALVKLFDSDYLDIEQMLAT